MITVFWKWFSTKKGYNTKRCYYNYLERIWTWVTVTCFLWSISLIHQITKIYEIPKNPYTKTNDKFYEENTNIIKVINLRARLHLPADSLSHLWGYSLLDYSCGCSSNIVQSSSYQKSSTPNFRPARVNDARGRSSQWSQFRE